MEDNNPLLQETLQRISVCLLCNRKVQEDHAFCMENEFPISMITSNVTIKCPLEKF